LMQKVTDVGGIAHANQRMLEYRDKALNVLHTFDKNDTRDALEGLVHLTVERKK